MSKTLFAENLRMICSAESSISEVCRQIGINRQQFNKYLNGTTYPSANNFRKICDFFDIRASEFHLPSIEFETHPTIVSRLNNTKQASDTNHGFQSAFAGQTKALRPYLGYFHSYFETDSWADHTICALVHLYEKDGKILSKTIERSHDPLDDTLYLSKYDGQVALLGNRIFVVEFQSLDRDALVETVLYPFGRGQLSYLRGTTFGVTSRQRKPFASEVVWKFLGTNIDVKAALNTVGLYNRSSKQLDQKVISILNSENDK